MNVEISTLFISNGGHFWSGSSGLTNAAWLNLPGRRTLPSCYSLAHHRYTQALPPLQGNDHWEGVEQLLLLTQLNQSGISTVF